MALVIPKNIWAPIVTCNTPGDLSVAYTRQGGVWAQSDGLVFAGFDLQFTPTYTTASGSFQIQGWPETILDNVTWGGVLRSITGAVTWPAGVTQLTPTFFAAGTTAPQFMQLVGSGTGINTIALAITGFTSGTAYRMQVSCFYAVGP